jgi:hypothetical protein
LELTITAAREFDASAAAGASCYLLPRTLASVTWRIEAVWDSSGQRIGKWAETPNLAPILAEVAAQPNWIANGQRVMFFVEVAGGAPEGSIRFDDTHPRWRYGGNPGIRPARLVVNETYYDAFWGKELLCRPTPTSVEVNVIPHATTLFVVDWGTSPGALTKSTPIAAASSASPAQMSLAGLTPGTRYHYRLRYRTPLGLIWQTAPTRSFITLPLAAWIRRWRRRSCIAPWATGSRVSSSTTACYGCTNATRWSARFACTWG